MEKASTNGQLTCWTRQHILIENLKYNSLKFKFRHLSIEEIFDIANHIVSFCRWREPSGYRDLLLVLHEHGVIPKEHLTTFQNVASFRNMLVPHYEKIDDEVVFGLFKKRLCDFELFVELISRWSMARD